MLPGLYPHVPVPVVSNNGLSSDDHFVTILLLSHFSASIWKLAFQYCTI